MEGFGSKQETKTFPGGRGAVQCWLQRFLLSACDFPEEFPMPAVPAKANPFRKELYQSLFIHFGHCSVEFSVKR